MKSMIKTLLLGSACGVAFTAAASAADLGAIPLRGPIGIWSGLYGGVNGGYAWNSGDAVTFDSVLGLRPNPRGGLFGVQVGYNWQWTPDWVFGVETDIDWADIHGIQNALTTGIQGLGISQWIAQQKVESLGTLRARAGYVVEDMLVYATGGLAYGQAEFDTSVTGTLAGTIACAPAGFCSVLGAKQWMVGWSAGVGFDWSFLPRWSFRTEYLHYDLGSQHQNLTDPGAPGTVITSNANFRGDILRGAINYRFF